MEVYLRCEEDVYSQKIRYGRMGWGAAFPLTPACTFATTPFRALRGGGGLGRESERWLCTKGRRRWSPFSSLGRGSWEVQDSGYWSPFTRGRDQEREPHLRNGSILSVSPSPLLQPHATTNHIIQHFHPYRSSNPTFSFSTSSNLTHTTGCRTHQKHKEKLSSQKNWSTIMVVKWKSYCLMQWGNNERFQWKIW